ncbi:diguanylate cyclase domain-containing protein [Ferrimonas marina]|uniref:diguanylate cyclase domain-containing protein n=1 Tax=Ferrimonas marina TaxID=299255 RepID=UPI0011610285|nr:diguanylate cyclase [Ferrimonas marina]
MRWFAILLFPLLVGLLSAGAAWWGERHQQQQHRQVLAQHAQVQGEAVNWRLRTTLEALYPMALMLADSPRPSAERFRYLAESVQQRQPQLQSLQWIPKVLAHERLNWEQRRRGSLPHFQLRERQGARWQPVGERPWYLPIYHAHGDEPLAAHLGQDLAIEPRSLAAFTRARLQRSLVFSRASGHGPDTLWAVLPVWGSPGQLLGYLRARLSLSELLIPDVLSAEQGMAYALQSASSPDLLLATPNFQRRVDTQTEPLPAIGGQQWQLLVSAIDWGPRWYGLPLLLGLLPWLLAAGGLAIGQLLRLHWQRRQTQQSDGVAPVAQPFRWREDELAPPAQYDEVLAAEWDAGRRSGEPLCLMLLTLDDPTVFQQALGETAFVQCQRALIRHLRQRVRRPRDLMAQDGAGRIALVLPETTENAAVLGQALVDWVRQAKLPLGRDDGLGAMTVSIGVAVMIPGPRSDAFQLQELADQALYRATQDGGNRVICFGSHAHLRIA